MSDREKQRTRACGSRGSATPRRPSGLRGAGGQVPGRQRRARQPRHGLLDEGRLPAGRSSTRGRPSPSTRRTCPSGATSGYFAMYAWEVRRGHPGAAAGPGDQPEVRGRPRRASRWPNSRPGRARTQSPPGRSSSRWDPAKSSLAIEGLADQAATEGRLADARSLLEKGIEADLAAKDGDTRGPQAGDARGRPASPGNEARAVEAAERRFAARGGARPVPGRAGPCRGGSRQAGGRDRRRVRQAARGGAQMHGQLLRGVVDFAARRYTEAVNVAARRAAASGLVAGALLARRAPTSRPAPPPRRRTSWRLHCGGGERPPTSSSRASPRTAFLPGRRVLGGAGSRGAAEPRGGRVVPRLPGDEADRRGSARGRRPQAARETVAPCGGVPKGPSWGPPLR